jgi:hypothetical protein
VKDSLLLLYDDAIPLIAPELSGQEGIELKDITVVYTSTPPE